tara:strand:+ start:404 stop:2560 length:2157 start_codon:yes stop_codon:yes gene_type:complete
MGAAGSGGPSDDQFNRVSFLSHFEGANNGVNKTFDDASASNHTIAANGNVTQGSFGPFARLDGEWGVRFPQNHPHYLDIPSSSDFAIASDADYTFEFFVFYDSKDSDQIIMDYRTGGNNGTFPYISIAGDLNYDGSDGSADTGKLDFNPHAGTLSVVKSASTLTFGAWNHVAIVRNSGTINFYINGTRDNNSYTNNTTVATAANIRFGDLALDSNAGADGSAGHSPGLQFSGVLSNFRFVNGTAVYSGSSITVPTSKLTAITNTKLLLFQSNRFVDNSTSGHTVAVSAGSPAVTAFGPFLTSSVYDPAVNGASAYFYGDDDYLSTGDSADFVLGDTFTLEAWVYPTVSVYNDWPMIMSQAGGYPTGWYISLQHTNEVEFYLNNADNAGGTIDLETDGSDPVQLNAWNHIAFSVSSGTGYIYVNGARKSSAATGINNNLDRSGTTFRVGSMDGSSYDFDGYISDARVVKGTALYSGTTYTIPTAPLTAITNTKLLLNMAESTRSWAGAQAIDSAAQHNLTLYGTAKTSTEQKKFGTASLLLDGDSDYAEIPSAAGDFGTGDWTIECSIRFLADVGNRKAIISKWETSGNKRGYRLALKNDSGNKIELKTSSNGSDGASVVTTTVFSTALNTFTWYNIALVNSSGTVKLYINGTADSTTQSLASGAPYQNPDVVVLLGAAKPSEPHLFFNGYIDEVRLSKFARYASNYTAPTKPFADKGQ